MAPWMWIALAAFLVVDAIVAVHIVKQVAARARLAGVDLRTIGRAAECAHAQIGDYLRANWSGDPASLGTALRGVMPVLRHVAREHGLQLDDASLEIVLATSVQKHGLASATQVREALRSAA
jgi:hypothetical protein